MAEQKTEFPHKLTLNQRETLTMSGVCEVVSFDEDTVALHTQLGTLIVQGSDLKLKTLSPEGGQVTIHGHVSSLLYEEPRPSLRRRLFG